MKAYLFLTHVRATLQRLRHRFSLIDVVLAAPAIIAILRTLTA